MHASPAMQIRIQFLYNGFSTVKHVATALKHRHIVSVSIGDSDHRTNVVSISVAALNNSVEHFLCQEHIPVNEVRIV